MARALSQTLTLNRALPRSLLTRSRPKSDRADKPAAVIEVDLGSGSVSEPGTGIEVHLGTLNRVEDAIYNIYAQKAATDWIPLVPGSSYWVPPKDKTMAVAAADFVRMIKATLPEHLTEDELMSLKTVRGWPSSSYYLEGTLAKRRSKKSAAQSDDEE